MSTTTPRNQLIRPGYADSADVEDINTNMDKIDASLAKANYTATTAPTANDDSGDGYSTGSIWLNVTAHNVYMCEVATLGAAVWKQVNTADGALLANGTVPLTANWNAGAYKITTGSINTPTVTGGTTASDDLTLIATTSVTKGSIILPDANLVLGTKAVTALDYAVGIQEGTAGAPNPVVFLDADGTTPMAVIRKNSSDQLEVAAGGTTTGLTVGAAGRVGLFGSPVVPSAAVNLSMGLTDPPGGAMGISAGVRPAYTGAESVDEGFYNLYAATFPEIRAGHSNTGNLFSFYTECMRNHNAIGTDDNGSLNNLIAVNASYGHFNSNPSMTGTTNVAIGLRVAPYGMTGTITNLFGLYIEGPATGGTMTTQYPIYTSWNAQHYFGGDIYTVGNCSAATFTDRTPGYEGDGISDLKGVKNKEGKVDHNTLPEFAKTTIEGKDKQPELARDLGAMISILVKAVQQIADKLDDLDTRVAKLEKKP